MESLNYHHLYYFWSVCHEGGFTKAADKLRLSQSAVSEQVARLEEVLGQKLIERTTRRLQLTEAGTVALRYADTIFTTGSELLDFMKHRPSMSRQTLRVGALGSLSRNFQIKFLEPLLDRQDVQFTVTVGDTKRLLRLLREHALDIVLSTFPAVESETDVLYNHLLSESPLCLVEKRTSGSRSKASGDSALSFLGLLERERVYLPTAALESRAEFDYLIESKGVRLNIGGEVDDIALLRVIALTGKGVVLVPKMGIQHDLQNKSLSLIHEFRSIRQRFYAITRQKKFPNPMIESLVRSYS